MLFQLKAFSAVFVVTSNADSGPGTLRDALTKAAANGSTEKDYINFNLPDLSEAGRTITISTKLPNVSSNLVIDGTTQPGVAFGVSNSKIILQPDVVSNNFNAFTLLNVNGFELYGLYVRDFIGKFYYKLLGNSENTLASALYSEASKNIQIGAVGKGNVFTNNEWVIKTPYASMVTQQPSPDGVENLKVFANFLGIEPDGKTQHINVNGYSTVGLDITDCKGDIEIGGDNVSLRNYFGYFSSCVVQEGNGQASAYTSLINIKNNYFNYDVNGQAIAILSPSLYTYMFSFINHPSNEYLNYPYTYNFIGNKILFPLMTLIYPVGGDITFQGNDELASPFDPGLGEKRIEINSQGKILIGGDQPGQGNTIYGCQLDINSPKSMILRHTNIYCVPTYAGGSWVTSGSYFDLMPKLSIDNISSSTVSGTATPHSIIDLYWDDDCHDCEAQTYFATVITGSDGKWSYIGTVNQGVIASATLNGFTSLYTSSAYITKNYSITQSSCGMNNGSISGFIFANSGGYNITDKNNNIVSSNANANNLAPGTYMLATNNGAYCSIKYPFTILDATPKINATKIKITQPSCGNNSGNITGITLNNDDVTSTDHSAYTERWLDASGNIVGSSLNLNEVAAGNYTLQVSYKNQCRTTYGPVILKNTTGPNIDQSQQQIQPTNCGQSTGSITNVQVSGGTGTYQYIWLNNLQRQVGTDKDITGQPAGAYKLQVTDGGQCGPVYSSEITIPEINGITLDESKAKTTAASCNLSTGSITGIAVSGATQYQWVDGNNKSYITATPDLANAPAGTYTLTASNGTGCAKTSQAYHIGQNAPIQFQLGMANSINIACTPLITATITLSAPDPRMSSFRWVNSQNQTIGTGLTITNLLPDTYQLYITDENGCENYYSSYVVPPYSPLNVIASTDVVNEKCGLKNGSIGTANITGGIPPYTYTWTDNSGTLIGMGNTIANLTAGSYTLSVANGPCGNINIPYVVGEDSEDIPPPSVSDVQLCSSGSVLLSVNSPSAAATYRLYDDADGAQPLAEQNGGRFNVTVAGNRSYFISQLNGTCESSRAEVKVTVGLSTLNIANTFTPNGDGINDYWEISNIENYPNAIVQVFNRYGQKLFESRGYSKPFDGTYSGKELAAGVYYYIINLSTNCNLLSGSLTIIR